MAQRGVRPFVQSHTVSWFPGFTFHYTGLKTSFSAIDLQGCLFLKGYKDPPIFWTHFFDVTLKCPSSLEHWYLPSFLILYLFLLCDLIYFPGFYCYSRVDDSRLAPPGLNSLIHIGSPISWSSPPKVASEWTAVKPAMLASDLGMQLPTGSCY